MNYLFIHQNFPGQFRHLAAHLASFPDHVVVGLGDAANLQRLKPLPNVRTIAYPSPATGSEKTHRYLQGTEAAIRRGQTVARACLDLRNKGFTPDVIVAHAGWGECLFLRDIFPRAAIVGYFEFYYQAYDSDVGFDPEFHKPELDDLCRIRIRNATHLLSFDACDQWWTPTRWQASRFPEPYQARMMVAHEGIDTRLVKPDNRATFEAGGKALTVDDEIVTFVARNLEPYRGFHIFMRMLPQLLEARPRAQVVIVGGDSVSYGRPPPEGGSWQDHMLKELGERIDQRRVHFVGRLPYERYLALLQVSSVHVYLTYPFVLSWSLLEAMAAECAIVASGTPPVMEIIQDGHNGRLVDFFDIPNWCGRITELLSDRESAKKMRRAARETILQKFDLHASALPIQLNLLNSLQNQKNTEKITCQEL